MKVLVTGAAGFIGSHLAERLAEMGHVVVGIDNFNSYYMPALKQINADAISARGVELLRLDLAEDNLVPILKQINYVVHLAAQPGISASTPFGHYARNNLQATYNLVEAAIQSDQLQGFLNVGTSSIYGADATADETTAPEPTSYYGVTKLAAEQLVLAYGRDKGMPASSLRLFSVYGPRERPEKLYPKLMHSILSGKPFPLYEGSEKHLRSYSFVGDIVDGIVLAIEKFDQIRGEVINIGTDTAITTGRGIEIVEQIMGQKAPIEVMPKRPGDQLKTHANIDKARRLLGYNPTTSPEDGLAKEVAWYRDEVYGKVNPYE